MMLGISYDVLRKTCVALGVLACMCYIFVSITYHLPFMIIEEDLYPNGTKVIVTEGIWLRCRVVQNVADKSYERSFEFISKPKLDVGASKEQKMAAETDWESVVLLRIGTVVTQLFAIPLIFSFIASHSGDKGCCSHVCTLIASSTLLVLVTVVASLASKHFELETEQKIKNETKTNQRVALFWGYHLIWVSWYIAIAIAVMAKIKFVLICLLSPKSKNSTKKEVRSSRSKRDKRKGIDF
ncbi:uncharacterized protein LOC142343047 [Convolutriloba macropyga]|uniref:uncharacterized protein LOC142343047 n=1 Tax=Convolutriloba macropyga TaxID=536237 RepID=UPI003F523738